MATTDPDDPDRPRRRSDGRAGTRQRSDDRAGTRQRSDDRAGTRRPSDDPDRIHRGSDRSTGDRRYPDRRTVLAAAGGALAALAGCTGGGGPDGFPDYGDATVVHATGADDAPVPVTLTADRERGTLPRAEFSFTLHNHGEDGVGTNWHDWDLHRWEDGDWYSLGPRAVPAYLAGLPPGEDHTWNVTVDNASLDAAGATTGEDGESIRIAGLGGGTYAFAANVTDDGERIAPVQRFELDGPDLELSHSGIVRAVDRDGETVVVEADRPGDTDDLAPAELVATRVEDPPEVRTMVTEQVLQEWPLRDALAGFERGVRSVRVETRTGGVPAFGIDDPPVYVRYAGEEFAVTTDYGPA